MNVSCPGGLARGSGHRPILIEVIFDPGCPWCFIGKRQLENALTLRPGLVATIHWWPFLLNPDMPVDGIDRTTFLMRKFGSHTRISRVFGAIADFAESVNINFAFDRIQRTPNTLNAHRLVRYADRNGRASAAVEALFVDHFVGGRDIGERGELIRIGDRLGLDPAALAAYLKSDLDVADVYAANARAHRLGINGVPTFVFEGAYVISGAQEPQVLSRMLDVARECPIGASLQR
jgi:predicted DsbA family dithiol-disulfide isomerase